MSPEIERLIPSIIGYFDTGVLAAYRELAHTYEVYTDNFEGRVESRASSDSTRRTPCLSVSFGFRVRKNADLALAVYLPDLKKADADVVERWKTFKVPDQELADLPDARFERWVRRYLEGDWNVQNGPLRRIRDAIRAINDLCEVAIGMRLFTSEEAAGLEFPKAQNDHAYQDAHTRLYGLVVDGFDKVAIGALAKRRGLSLNIANDKTLKALRHVLPAPESTAILDPLEKLSVPRRAGSHGARPTAMPFPAFERFANDADGVAAALDALRNCLANEFNLAPPKCAEYLAALRSLPRIDDTRPTQPNYLIWRLTHLKGRRIENVHFGYEERKAGHHDAEAAILHLDDGSQLAIATRSNAQLISEEMAVAIAEGKGNLDAKQFHVGFMITYVPPKPI